MTIRMPTPADLTWMLALNRQHERELSPLDRNAMQSLLGVAAFVRIIEPATAFMIGLDQDADYDSPNFRWFQSRYDRFLYVDRIVVDADQRGRGHARRLYTAFFAHASQIGQRRIACEVNSVPPNPDSDAFHQALGFQIVGDAELPDRARSVRYLLRPLDEQAALTSVDDAGTKLR